MTNSVEGSGAFRVPSFAPVPLVVDEGMAALRNMPVFGPVSVSVTVCVSPVDVVMTAGFGLFGYALVKFGFEPAPLLLGFVLGKLMEEKLRQALVISRGTFMTFIDRPLSGGLLAVSLVLV